MYVYFQICTDLKTNSLFFIIWPKSNIRDINKLFFA